MKRHGVSLYYIFIYFLILDVDILHMCIDIANGVAFLHSFIPQIIHCDLTSKNILLDEKLTAKISDLGLSR